MPTLVIVKTQQVWSSRDPVQYLGAKYSRMSQVKFTEDNL